MDAELLNWLKTLTTHAEVASLIAFVAWCKHKEWVSEQILVSLLLGAATGLGLKITGAV